MTDWYLGTMGYGYKDWVGVFYPHHAKPQNYLRHYCNIFNAVEMDSTFYGTPRTHTVKNWAAQTSDHFKFCPKTPRAITHEPQLGDKNGLMLAFVETMQNLGNKLGPFLIQFPPDFSMDRFPELESFLNGLPDGQRYAVEFRHRSWLNKKAVDLLEAHKICWVTTDYIIMPKDLHRTTDFLYIRWIGRHGRFERKDRIQIDVSGALEYWWKKIDPILTDTPEIFGFVNNEYSGHAPITLNDFKKRAGLPFTDPQIPKQSRLF